MQLNLRQTEDLTIMQANGEPEELAEFVERLGLVSVPVLVDSDDALADVETVNEVAF